MEDKPAQRDPLQALGTHPVCGGDARTRDECQARGAGRAGPASAPSVPPPVRPCVRPYDALENLPKVVQDYWNSIRCIDENEDMSFLFEV